MEMKGNVYQDRSHVRDTTRDSGIGKDEWPRHNDTDE